MTWLGKILLLGNLALSVFLAAWGMTLYTTRVDWTDQTGKDGRPNGELVERKKLLEDGLKALSSAPVGWDGARKKLIAMEDGGKLSIEGKEYVINGRRANQKWYVDQLEALRKGGQPIKVLKLDELQRLTFDVADPLTPRPQFTPSALHPYEWYDKEEQTARESLIAEENRLAKAIKEDSDLTDQLVGAKGLHKRISDERAKRRKIVEEQELVKLPLINTFVESDVLLKRMRSLELRLDELQKARAAKLAGLGGR